MLARVPQRAGTMTFSRRFGLCMETASTKGGNALTFGNHSSLELPQVIHELATSIPSQKGITILAKSIGYLAPARHDDAHDSLDRPR